MKLIIPRGLNQGFTGISIEMNSISHTGKLVKQFTEVKLFIVATPHPSLQLAEQLVCCTVSFMAGQLLCSVHARHTCKLRCDLLTEA